MNIERNVLWRKHDAKKSYRGTTKVDCLTLTMKLRSVGYKSLAKSQKYDAAQYGSRHDDVADIKIRNSTQLVILIPYSQKYTLRCNFHTHTRPTNVSELKNFKDLTFKSLYQGKIPPSLDFEY